MNRLTTIQSRLAMLGAVVALGLVALNVIAVFERRATARHSDAISQANSALKQILVVEGLHGTIRGDVYALLMSSSDAGAAHLREVLATDIAVLGSNLEPERVVRLYPELAAASSEFSEPLTRYAEVAAEIAALLAKDRLAAVTRLAEFLELYGQVRDGGARLSSELKRAVAATRLRSEERLRLTSLLATTVSLLMALSVIAIAARLLHSIRRSLLGLREHVERVAGGDLTAWTHEDSDDELGQLGRRLGRMTASIRATVEDVGGALASVEQASRSIGELGKKVDCVSDAQLAGAREASAAMRGIQSEVVGISETSGALRTAVDGAAVTIAELRDTCTRLTEQAAALEGSVDESVESIRDFTESAGMIASRTDCLARAADDGLGAVSTVGEAGSEVNQASEVALDLAGRVIKTVEAGRLRVRETLVGMDNILNAERTTVNTVRMLGERALEIGEVADVIDRVAEDTKLLALNTAIVAAQAGEEGRSFAVIAREIREMAVRARGSTELIHELVDRVQNETIQAVETMDRNLAVVEKEVARSQEAGEALEEIHRAAAGNGEQVRQISIAAVRQAQLCDEARKHLQGVLSEAVEIRVATGQQEKAAKQLLARCEVMEAVGRAVAQASQRQNQGTERLAEMAEGVRQATCTIDVALGEQARDCSKVVDLLENICEQTRQSAVSLHEEVTELLGQSDSLRTAFRKFRT